MLLLLNWEDKNITNRFSFNYFFALLSLDDSAASFDLASLGALLEAAAAAAAVVASTGGFTTSIFCFVLITPTSGIAI